MFAKGPRWLRYVPFLVAGLLWADESAAQEAAHASRLDRVRHLYELKCSRCHAAHDPTEYSSEEWPGLVRSMRSRASLTEEEYTDIVAFLTENTRSSAASSPSARPVIGGYLYTEYFRSPERVKNFDIHYLTFSASGWAGKRIEYLGEFELEHGGVGGSNTFVEQAYLDYWILPSFGVRVGAILTPFNRFDDFHEPLANFTITRPQVAREIGVSAWKDVGVVVHGNLPIFDSASLLYDLYAINGLGSGANLRGSRQYRDNNEALSYGSRLSMVLKDVLEIGGSVYRGPWDDDGALHLTMLGSHLRWRSAIVDLYGEYYRAVSENGEQIDDGVMSGYFAQASRLIRGLLRPTVRVGLLDYDDPGQTLGRSENEGTKNVSEVAVALAIYPSSRVVFKFEYTWFDELGARPEIKNNQVGLQAAVSF